MRRWFAVVAMLALIAGVAVSAGNAGKAPATGLTPSPSRISFGRVPVATISAPISVTITNNTAEALFQNSFFHGDSNALSGWGNFTYTNGSTCVGATLAVSGTCTVNVVFQPSDVGRVSDTLYLGFTGLVSPYNEPGSLITVTGTGYSPKKPTPF